ncbi:uncharacterized protein LOC143619525 [Bidens hawaiensis]|uniref:uncharacterized protein LOC143619525 n=1 Tax=Bidens hawaiensis TaxID=980011 RepID=UPI0040491D98
MSSLSPSCNLSAFSKVNLLMLAEVYPCDFDFDENEKLVYELGRYISNVKEDKRFANLSGLGDLAKMMVKTRLHVDYPLFYHLIKLSLVLPVATASVERCFSSMKNVKTDLRNRMWGGYMNDSCICYIEREFLQQVSVEEVTDLKTVSFQEATGRLKAFEVHIPKLEKKGDMQSRKMHAFRS